MPRNTRILTRDVAFRAADGTTGDGKTLEGYCAIFGEDTEIDSWEGRFTERIAKGAFRKTLRERRPVLQYNHGTDQRVGSVPIGRIEIAREDDRGLYVRARLFQNDAVEPVREAIAERAINGMSFTFEPVRDEWTDNAGRPVRGDELWRLLHSPGDDRGPLRRTLREVRLYEAGPVVFPAYEGTSVGVRTTTSARTLSHTTAARRLALLTTLSLIGDDPSENLD
ncbi:HK97 family phage prohead protease [Rhodococcus koreensis]|uniref:HK97 family phage prohead protease n=1 Tax=Rhodococcus koreensis TaxID=99653 RepID=UPI0036DB535A